MKALPVKGKLFSWGKETYICGIINMTPDSFSGDGLYKNRARALKQAEKMIKAGADLLDIGGESSRPGAQRISAKEERARVIPLIKALAQSFPFPLSIDTYKAEVAKAALEAGADFINDITALRGDKKMVKLVEAYKPPVILMHMQGTPQTMQKAPFYLNPVQEIAQFLKERKKLCLSLGLPEEKILIDPGIGFGKRLVHNMAILKKLKVFKKIAPLFLGFSRKSLIGQLTGKSVADRLYGTLALAAYSLSQKVDVLRVHDVEAIQDVRKVLTPLTQNQSYTYYLSLGSNQEPRLTYLSQAREKLESNYIFISQASSIYETLPEEMPSKNNFYNQVLKVSSFFKPEELLKILQRIEQEMGRKRNTQNRDRPIDLDIIHWEGQEIKKAFLELPHPRAENRGFVLYPLGEIDPLFLKKQGWKRKKKGIIRKVDAP